MFFFLQLEVVLEGLVHEATVWLTETTSGDGGIEVEHVNALVGAIILGPDRATVGNSGVGVSTRDTEGQPFVHDHSGEGSIVLGPGVGGGVVQEWGGSKDNSNVITVADLSMANVANGVVAVSALEVVLVDGVLGLGEGLGNELSGADLFGRKEK